MRPTLSDAINGQPGRRVRRGPERVQGRTERIQRANERIQSRTGKVVKKEKEMFTPENFKHLNYIKKEPLTGSYQGMRYMLSKKKKEEETYMQGVVWPEPFGFHATKEEQKIYQDFTLDADGLADAIAWLNAMYEKFRKD